MLPVNEAVSEAYAEGGAEQRPGVRHQGPVRDSKVTNHADEKTGGRKLRRGNLEPLLMLVLASYIKIYNINFCLNRIYSIHC